MKTLEELGTSPAPWKPADDGIGYRDILCNGTVTEDVDGENIIAEAVDSKDANMMAAAPEMYDALYGVIAYNFPYGEQHDLCIKCAREIFPEKKESEMQNEET